MSTKTSKARNFKGTEDVQGSDMEWRLNVIDKIRTVYASFGFVPIETPILESMATLLGKSGSEQEKGIFAISTSSKSKHQQPGMRFDHTVPLARFVAQWEESLVMPYRRSAIGPVFRNEAPQAGKLRQFNQCDFDTVGSRSPLVDAEIPAVNYAVLTALGFPAGSFIVKINDRRLLNALISTLQLDEGQEVEVYREWDKADKIAFNDILTELFEKGFSVEAIDRFKDLTEVLEDASHMSWSEAFDYISSSVNNVEVDQALDNLVLLFGNIQATGIPEWAIKFSPLLARGHDYYTGPIFEVDAGGNSAIAGGGRFDNLIEVLGGPDLPASGSSFGLERLMKVMKGMGLQPEPIRQVDVFVTVFDQGNTELVKASFAVASELRSLTNLKVELYTGEPTKKFGKQFDIANKKGARFVLIIGPDEAQEGKIMVKTMATGDQQVVDRLDLVSYLTAS